ncbi:MAG: response regulator [Herminiimonas sp.]|nr:response regulator [Herminiimonas sp.]
MPGMQPTYAVAADTGSAPVVLPAARAAALSRERTLLLVDDEANILSALKRLLRGDGYRILTAGSGADGLAVLGSHPIDVIVSDQRMPGMTGVEFLSLAKTRHPETIRIVLSGYTELQSVTDAVNEGAIYKFLTKPWDDTKLRGHIREAFERKELAEENRRLVQEVQAVNRELATANRQLALSLQEKQQQVALNDHMLAIIREVLQQVPIPVLAVDDTDMIVFVNEAATRLLERRGMLLGGDAQRLLPDIMHAANVCTAPMKIENVRFFPAMHTMGNASQSRGKLITLMPVSSIANVP